MDKVLSCVERIRVVKRVSFGIITTERIEHLFEIFKLDEEKKKRVFAILKENNITPIPDAEMREKVRNLLYPVRIEDFTDDPEELYEESMKERYKRYFNLEVSRCKLAIKNDSTLAQQYEEELPIFADKLKKYNVDTCGSVENTIALAAIDVGFVRNRKYKKTVLRAAKN